MSPFSDALVVADDKAYEAAEGIKGVVKAADEFAGDKAEAASNWAESSILAIRNALHPSQWQCLARKPREPETPQSPERFSEWELEEHIVCVVPGPLALPWHPSQQPNVCKLCLLGETSAGKSALIRRLISRSFDARHDPTACVRQHFWRCGELLVELEVRRGVGRASAMGAGAVPCGCEPCTSAPFAPSAPLHLCTLAPLHVCRTARASPSRAKT